MNANILGGRLLDAAHWETPTYGLLRMHAEIGSYQEDSDPGREPPSFARETHFTDNDFHNIGIIRHDVVVLAQQAQKLDRCASRMADRMRLDPRHARCSKDYRYDGVHDAPVALMNDPI